MVKMSNVITYYGLEKTGKTTFGFTAIRAFLEGILVHFDFDLGRERAIWRFPKSLADRIQSIRFPEVPNWTLGSGAITAQWAKFEQYWDMALHDPQVKVLFIDTGTQMHKLNADEYLENYVKRNKPNRHQLQQIEYRIPNSRTRAKYMSAREAEKLLIVSHYEGDVYQEQFVQRPDGSMVKESVKTGVKTHSGFGDTPYLTDYNLQLLLRNMNRDPNTGAELQPPTLRTVGKILTPNPPDA
ncbi:hypothetical protein LCGC14_1866050, partial [marine sediment metagenome]